MKKHGDNLSEQDLNEQINDKLNQLWSGMKDKKRHLMKSLTPSYSRRTDQSELNNSTQYQTETQNISKLRNKLASEVSAGKHKELELDTLRKTIVQLTNEKNLLLYELQTLKGHEDSKALNESSILTNYGKQGQTASFSTYKKSAKKGKCNTIVEEQSENPINMDERENLLENISKKRLIQLLRSTAEYREFIYFYDSHELSYLKRLQTQHKKNCDHLLAKNQKMAWGPTEILLKFHEINQRQNLDLSEETIQLLIYQMKSYYDHNEQLRIRKIRQEYESRYRKLEREKQYAIPYDLVQICQAKERQLAKKRKRTNTLK